ncbi:tetratricopeptide repeat protein [Streptacidiphilus sp. PAMC 29251]
MRTVAPGYLIEVNEGELDTEVFTGRCGQGRLALDAGDHATAARVLAGALALWRGEPYADLPPAPDVLVETQRLRETRLLALEGRIEADLGLGRHRELVAEIRALADAHPLREALHGQLMLALYRAERQAEALDVFRALRRTLVDGLGVEPTASLQELHRRILGADPALLAGSAPLSMTAAPVTDSVTAAGLRYQLPSDTRAFTGRSRELGTLLALAERAPAGSGAGMVVISAIDGMAGVGKSALAVHAAHLLRANFPDGQLFIDLQGHTPGLEPLTAGEALDRLLRSLGVPPKLIPADLGQRAAFYRDRLAATRTLIVLDNAANTAQVRPLLPATPGCLVVVTSRKRLTGLDDAHSLALDLLPDCEAVALLHMAAGPGRIPMDHPATGELIALCGHMPLAIRIIGARLRHRRTLRIEDLVQQLRDEHGRLDRFQDEDRNLTAVFETSYHALPTAEQLLFRLLGQVPGADFEAYAAANLLGTDHRSAEFLLESLLDHNLLSQHTPGRYRFHDLVRLYAGSLGADSGDSGDSRAALERLLDHYQHTADAADRRLARHTRPPADRPADGVAPTVDPELRDRAGAMAWMRAERETLLAAARTGPSRLTALAAALASFLQQEGPWPQAAALHRAAADAARDHADPVGEANALHELGRVSYLTGDYPGAGELFQQALTAFQGLGERLGEANALNELGRVRFMTGDIPAAAELYQQALTVHQQLGERLGEANALSELGRVRYLTGDYPAVTQLFERALVIFQDLGEPLGAGNALCELGRLRRLAGDFPGAAALLEQARVIFQDLGNRHGHANTLWDLGRVRYATGDLAAAAGLHEQALAIYQDLGHRLNEAYARQELGRVRHATGDLAAAAELHERALAIFQDLGHRHGEANTRHELGRVRHSSGDPAAAAELLARSLALLQDLGDPQAEAEVLISTAALTAETTGPREALPLYRQALRLAREVRSPLDEARALEGAARCAAELGDHGAARADLEQATTLYQKIGAVGSDAP